MTRVIIIDDHQVIVDGLRSVLSREPSIAVVGWAPSLARGLMLIDELDPEVIILDLRLLDVSGGVVVERTRAKAPGAKIIVLSGYGSKLTDQILRAGADAFLSKETASDQLVRMIRRFFPKEPQADAFTLSDREREVAELAAAGRSNPEIARILGISANTVKTHISRVLSKTGAASRIELALDWSGRSEARGYSQ